MKVLSKSILWKFCQNLLFVTTKFFMFSKVILKTKFGISFRLNPVSIPVSRTTFPSFSMTLFLARFMTSFLTCFTKILTVSNFVIFCFRQKFHPNLFYFVFSSFSQSFLKSFLKVYKKHSFYTRSQAPSRALAPVGRSLLRRFSALTLSSLYVSLPPPYRNHPYPACSGATLQMSLSTNRHKSSSSGQDVTCDI